MFGKYAFGISASESKGVRVKMFAKIFDSKTAHAKTALASTQMFATKAFCIKAFGTKSLAKKSFAKKAYGSIFLRATFGFYKLFISPLLGGNCRFYPTCSHYAYLMARYENPFYASFYILYRIARCQPFAKGGIEYPIIHTSLLRLRARFGTPNMGRGNGFKSEFVLWLIPLARISFSLFGADSRIMRFALIPALAGQNLAQARQNQMPQHQAHQNQTHQNQACATAPNTQTPKS
ncbi:membrane protein insertion efficiency factor YidD [Helicobacter sp. CLO-3]|uniref:membrane protein insertion efficiency factor YidD n=1 Tax=Helicobacter sp. CLO-3 TaxID=211 RepID=UPI0020A53673|nr:membrane protein insertion efficiency factor YidD [Helicobacter sp. CLO-3]